MYKMTKEERLLATALMKKFETANQDLSLTAAARKNRRDILFQKLTTSQVMVLCKYHECNIRKLAMELNITLPRAKEKKKWRGVGEEIPFNSEFHCYPISREWIFYYEMRNVKPNTS